MMIKTKIPKTEKLRYISRAANLAYLASRVDLLTTFPLYAKNNCQ